MKTKLSLFLLLALSPLPCALSQIPQGFNYQAVAHNSAGAPVMNTTLQVKAGILSDTITPVIVWEELHSAIKTNAYGVFNLVVGKGTRQAGSAQNFSDVDWSKSPLYLKIQIYYQGAWKVMGHSKLWSVPYAMASGDISAPLKKLSVAGETDNLAEALFEVKNKDGQTVFAVYNEGVRIYVSDGDTKGPKGGFAIGGFGTTKAPSQPYFIVRPDSIRMYLYDTIKGPKGGFAIGGYGTTKTGSQDYLFVSSDSIRAYIDNGSAKGPKGGFAIGGFGTVKSKPKNYFNVATDTSNIINPSQNRILWYPSKNAFLAGRVLIEDPDSVGINSFATGYESKAIGQYSQALGFKSISLGDFATAIGKRAVANNINSFAFGDNAKALNNDSYAFGAFAEAKGVGSFAFGYAGRDSTGPTGRNTVASGNFSFAFGLGCEADSMGSIAFGSDNKATNYFSQAFGLSTVASGHTATTFGYKTEASSFTAMAIGTQTVSSAHGSFAGGTFCEATDNNAFSFGFRNQASGDNSVAMGLDGKSTGFNSFSAGHFNEANGDNSAAFGTSNIVNGKSSFAGGQGNQAVAGNALAFGFETKVSAVNSIAMGTKSISAGGSSIALGDSVVASEFASVALGNRSIASGYSSMATGQETIASGIVSFAGGVFSKASEHHSFAFGYNAVASSNGSVAIGTNVKATNSETFAAGNLTRADGWNSTAFGNGTVVKSYSAFVLGRFNDTTNMTNTPNDPILIVGNGISHTDRKNALTVLQNSNVGINMVNPQQKLDIAGGNGRVESGYDWLTNSDLRYKKNITTLEDALEKVMNLRGVRFDINNDSDTDSELGKHIGFIAQELETVVPEVVVTGVDGYKSVAYDKLTAVLAEAIKEQQQQIESQHKEIEELKELVRKLTAE